MEVRIPRVQIGVNEEGFPIMSPADNPPREFTACEITETEYIYTVEDEAGQ